jgi:prefoldin subunit 5
MSDVGQLAEELAHLTSQLGGAQAHDQPLRKRIEEIHREIDALKDAKEESENGYE